MEMLIVSVRRESAGMMSPILNEIISLGTKSANLISRQEPSV